MGSLTDEKNIGDKYEKLDLKDKYDMKDSRW